IVASFREIMVTDRYGRLVAASSKASDYYQADENWWRVAYLEGEGQRFISDVVYDESARVYCIEIAEPIRNPTSGGVVGIIKTIVDSDTLFGMLDSSRYRESTVAVLVREDGTIVSDPGSSEVYPFIEQIKAERALNRSYLAAPSGKPEVFLGLPTLSVKDRLPELGWTLVIQAPYEDVVFPIRDLKRWFLYIVIFSVSLVIILSLVFTWILSKPIVEIDPHLDRV
ncbi:MAG: cache domain-containing protein, partial [Acidobacteriota bacterium]